jgi:hypothetical protein
MLEKYRRHNAIFLQTIAMGYLLDGRGIWVRFSAKEKHFFLLHSAKTSSETHLVASPMGSGGSFPGDKVAGA